MNSHFYHFGDTAFRLDQPETDALVPNPHEENEMIVENELEQNRQTEIVPNSKSIELVKMQVDLMGIRVNNVVMATAVKLLLRGCQEKRPQQVCFVNADCVNIAAHDNVYHDVLCQSEMTFIDGIGMKLAGDLLRVPVVDNVNGTDLFPELCKAIGDSGERIYLLGGRPGVACKVKRWIETHYPNVTVCGEHHGYFSETEEPQVIEQIAKSGTDILLVAFGVPCQEKWLQKNLVATGAKIGMGVGGLFDFYSGRIRRAPRWMRWCKIEWCYRLLQEPKRMWKRYLIGNVAFLLRVVMERIRLGRAGMLTRP